jgi:WD40 repeat protein/GTPase SAR1 family protein
MSDNFSYDVFLSHNAKDKPRVRRLAERLQQAGLRVWFDEWNVRSGDIISLKVDEGLEQSRVLLLCISPNALASNWVALERSTAIHRDPSNKGRRFIPVLLAACELPDTLRRYNYLDFRRATKTTFAKLLRACRPEGEAPPAATPEPKKDRAEKKPKLVKPQQQNEPLAVLERKLTGHKGWVKSVAVSPDGKWTASGSDDETIKIWDLETGKCCATLKGHSDKVWSVAVTRDGETILSGSADKTARLWSVRTGKSFASWEGHHNDVLSVVTLADPRHAATAGNDDSIAVWDILTNVHLRSVKTSSLRSGTVTPDGRRGVVGCTDGAVEYWDLKTGKCLARMEGHSDRVYSVQVTPDGRIAFSGSGDKTVKVWDLEAGVCIGTLEGHQSHVQSIAISPDGTMIASTGFIDNTVRLWDWKSGACLQVIEHERNTFPTSVTFSPDGSRLVVGTSDSLIYIYRLTCVRGAPSVEAAHRYVNAKVVLLGEGTVGKTSLAHRLIEDKYVVRDRTHGMNVWPLPLPLAPDATLEREALLWDLAGQEDYRLIHKLFLDETALALLLVNPQKEDPFAEAGDWLKSLESSNDPDSKRTAERLLIFSQTDVGGMKLGKAKIERFREQYGFANWLSTSAKSGENCSDQENAGQPSKLKQLIAGSIPWDKLPWTSTPRLLAELKDAMMAMRDKTDIRLVRFAELAQRLEQALPGERFGESEVRTAVTLLANNGLARPLKFGDLVLLQPELLNGYAGAIIRAARAHTDEIGCVLESKIYDPEFDFTGVERLKNRPDEELLLRALVQTFLDHSLCIAEDMEQGRQLVFPSQYRREKDIPRDPDIFVSYSFSGEWQTVWTTLVVRLWYSQEFEHRELWRNAAEFASGKGHTLGLKIDNKQGEGTATISLYFDVPVPDELKVIFIEYVHRHLAKYGCEVSRDRRYVCPNPKCGKPVKDHDEVRERLAAGKAFIYCQKCDKKVPLIDFIEQRLKSDLVAREIMAMDATATRELDTQALEQILIGHMMAIAGEANQVFRPVTMFDYGIDGEVEFKDDNGKASGKKIYIQLKSGNSYLRTRKSDGGEVFDVTNERHLEYWISQPVDVYLVIRQMDETSGGQIIRWMNVTRYLKSRRDKTSRQIVFVGEKLDMEAVWKARDKFFPPTARTRK